jgi:hypothetical protein
MGEVVGFEYDNPVVLSPFKPCLTVRHGFICLIIVNGDWVLKRF